MLLPMFRQRISVALALTAALTLTAPAAAQAPQLVAGAAFTQGSAEGPQYPSLYGNNGDLMGWRNLQGGSNEDHDFDIAAGSTADPGTVSINFDVGKALRVYDGRKRLLARFDRTGIHFYGPVHFHKR